MRSKYDPTLTVGESKIFMPSPLNAAGVDCKTTGIIVGMRKKSNQAIESESDSFLKRITDVESSLENIQFDVGSFFLHENSNLFGIVINGDKKSSLINVPRDLIIEIDNHPHRDQLVQAIFKIDPANDKRRIWYWLVKKSREVQEN